MVLNEMGQTEFLVGRDDHVGGMKDFGVGVGDGGGQSDGLEHGQIVQVVTDRRGLFCRQIQLLADALKGGTFGDAGGKDFIVLHRRIGRR